MQVNCNINGNFLIVLWGKCYSKVILVDLERELNKVKYSRNKIKVFCLYIKNLVLEGYDQVNCV